MCLCITIVICYTYYTLCRFTAYAFAAAVAVLLFGPQDRDTNPVLNVFWCWWWPGIFLLYPFVGRIWCSGVCVNRVCVCDCVCVCVASSCCTPLWAGCDTGTQRCVRV